jgi:Putative DNA-binding domain
VTQAAAKKRVKRRDGKIDPQPVLTLAELQHSFQAAVMAGEDAILALIPDNSRTGREVLLGVYRNAYVSRLADIVAHDHPILARYMGDEAFDVMARAYIAAHPSRHPNVRWFSQGLPEFLASREVYNAPPELTDLAHLERALNAAFDAADAPLLDIAALSQRAPERWGDLCFEAHPSAARHDCTTNAFSIWHALKDEAPPPPAEKLCEPERLLVWRNDVTPAVRPLGAEEAMMWDEAVKGVRFSVLCELVATYAGGEGAALRAARYLQGWIAAGTLSKARLARSKIRSWCRPGSDSAPSSTQIT